MADRSDPIRSTPVSHAPSPRPAREAVQRWRLVVDRDAPGADRQGDQAAWEAALVRSGLPIAGPDLPAPRPRFAIAAPLPAGIRGEAELVDLWLTDRLPRWHLWEVLEARLPAGNRLVDVYDAWLGEPALPGLVVASVYRVSLAAASASLDALRGGIGEMLSADALPRQRVKGDTTVTYDLRPFIVGLEVVVEAGRTSLRMTLAHDPEKGMGRPEEVLAELGSRAGGPIAAAALVRERIVLRERSPEPPARQGPARRAAPGRRL